MKIHYKTEGIAGLIVVFTVGFFALAGALAILSAGFLGLVNNTNLVLGNQSFYTAESASTEGVYQRINASSYVGGTPSLINNTSAGSITVQDLPSFELAIKGVVLNTRSERRVTKVISLCPACQAFTYGLYSGRGLSYGGTAKVNGDTYSNADLDIGGSSQVNGNAFAVGTVNVSGSAVVTGTEVSNATSVPTPQADYAKFQSDATAAGTYFVDDPPGKKSQTAEQKAQAYISSNLTKNAIVYIDTAASSVTITVSSPFIGTIITPVDLVVKGAFNASVLSGPKYYPALVTKGSLKLNGNTTVNGVIYIQGDINTTGANNAITGSVIFSSIGSTLTVNGTVTITYDKTYFDHIEDFVGFTTSPTAPVFEVVSWNED